MPILDCQVDGRPGKKYGPSGKCYTGPNARARALKQARAIEASRQHNITNVEPQRVRNPLRADPTRTITLRRQFEIDISKRFRRIANRIWRLVVEEDAFGLHNRAKPNPLTAMNEEDRHDDTKQGPDVHNSQHTRQAGSHIHCKQQGHPDNSALRLEPTAVAIPPAKVLGCDNARQGDIGNANEPHRTTSGDTDQPSNLRGHNLALQDHSCTGTRVATLNTRWAFRTDQQKVVEFQQWLQLQVDTELVGVTADQVQDAYFYRYAQQGYEKGMARAFDDTRQAAKASGLESLDFYEGTRREFLQSAFGHPVAIEKVKLLAGRTFTDLKGITSQMSTVITRQLVDGLVQGKGPREIARSMIKAGIGTKRRGVQSRALTIARTEIIRAHAEGQLDSMEKLGVDKVGVMAEWSTAGDDRVCPQCQPLEATVLSIREARGILPRHANCRCTFVPANVGESRKGRLTKFKSAETGRITEQRIPQKRSKEEIQQAFGKSIKAEAPKRSLDEQRKRTQWAGADKTVREQRPKSILGVIDKPEPRVPKPTPPTPVTAKPTAPLRPKPRARPKHRVKAKPKPKPMPLRPKPSPEARVRKARKETKIAQAETKVEKRKAVQTEKKLSKSQKKTEQLEKKLAESQAKRKAVEEQLKSKQQDIAESRQAAKDAAQREADKIKELRALKGQIKAASKAPPATVQEAQKIAKQLKAPKVVTSSKEATRHMSAAANDYKKQLRKLDPVAAKLAPDAKDIEKHWSALFETKSAWTEGGAFNKIDPHFHTRVQTAVNYNQQNKRFTLFKKKFGEERIILSNQSRLGSPRRAEYRGGTTLIYQDKFVTGPVPRSLNEASAFIERQMGPKFRKQNLFTMSNDGGVAGTLRHEYGHGLYDKMGAKKRREWTARFVDKIPNKQVKTALSEYATKNGDEMLSETFSLITHPSYNRANYPTWVGEAEDFLLGLL